MMWDQHFCQSSTYTNKLLLWSTFQLFWIMLVSLSADQWTLRTVFSQNFFFYIQYTMNSLKLQSPKVSNVNSDCLYSELLRFPSIIGPWEDRILPQPAGERDTQRERRAETRKGKRDTRGESAQRNWNPFPLGRHSLVSLPTSYLMSLWRIRVRLPPRCLAEGEILSARWSESTLYDRQMGRHQCWQALLSKWVKKEVGWLSSMERMAELQVCEESRYQNLVGSSCTLPIIELKALLNFSFVQWELDS